MKRKVAIGYWGRDEFIKYYLQDGNVKEEGRIALDVLKDSAPRKKGYTLAKRYLVVSRENLILLKKEFPRADSEKLERIIALDLLGLGYPQDSWGFHYRIFETKGEKMWVHLWIWDKEKKESILSYFRPQYLIPEDLCFRSEVPAIFIMPMDGGKFYAVVVNRNTFYHSAIFNDQEDMIEEFPLLAGHFEAEDIVVHNFSDLEPATFEALGGRCETVEPSVSLPSVWLLSRSLDEISSDAFRVGSKGEALRFDPLILLNTAMIVVCALGINFYVRNHYLGRYCDEKHKKIAEEFGNVSRILHEKKELEKKKVFIKNAALAAMRDGDFFKVMNNIYAVLPKTAYLRDLAVEGNKVTLKIRAKKPVEVLRAFERKGSWRHVSIRGPLIHKEDGYVELVIRGEVDSASSNDRDILK